MRRPRLADADVAFVERPLRRWSRARRAVKRAPFVVVPVTAQVSVVRSLLPALLGGRPIVVDGDTAAAPAAWRLRPLSAATVAPMTTDQRALAALAQARQLFGCEDAAWRRPLIGVVMATKRPAMVAGAIRQIQAQRFVDVELHVGLHGFDGAEIEEIGEIAAVGGAVVRAEISGFARETPLGDVLDQLSRAVTASTVSKWDDDDLYGVHHLFDLWLLRCLSGAPLVAKGAESVLLVGADKLARRDVGTLYRRSEGVAGGSLTMSTLALRAIGGWPPARRGVDHHLLREFARNGLRTERIHGYEMVVVRHGIDHTWQASDESFLTSCSSVLPSSALDRVGVLRDAPATPLFDG